MINFPAGCDNPGKKIAFLERAEEKLRLVNNGMAMWESDGLTQTQYDKFPLKVRNRYAYKAKLTMAEFRDFESAIFRKMSSKIHLKKNEILLEAKQDNTTWNPDLDTDVTDG